MNCGGKKLLEVQRHLFAAKTSSTTANLKRETQFCGSLRQNFKEARFVMLEKERGSLNRGIKVCNKLVKA